MNAPLLVATKNGLVTLNKNSHGWHQGNLSLEDKEITAVIAREGVILAGTTDGIYRSQNSGSTWEETSAGLDQRHVRWLAYHPDVSDAEFAGTEPAGIYVSRDGGDSWRACPEVAQLRDENEWFLPYSPEAGCVRGFAFHGKRVYAAVEVGGVLRSDDGGATWALAPGCDGNPDFGHPLPPGFVHTDVHSVEVHPTSANLVFAATNAGLYRSQNGGETWENIFPHHYCRAVWVDPSDAAHILLGPAESVSRKGRIEKTTNGGETWHAASDGLDTPWPRQMVERFAQIGSELFAVLSGGALLVTSLDRLLWQEVLPASAGVQAVSTIRNGN